MEKLEMSKFKWAAISRTERLRL